MTIQMHLDRLCSDNAGCSLTAFADMSSGLTLRWSSEDSCPREILDELSARAAACFDLLGSDVQTPATELTGLGSAVVHFTAGKSRVFVRHPEESEDVVCAVCDPVHPIEPVLGAARDVAIAISEER